MPDVQWLIGDEPMVFGSIPKIMGIVNVTPDSFSDGGSFFEASAAVDHAMKLVDDGADILDIGGESTRPYSESVPQADELKRVMPVIEKLAQQTNVPISIDTSKPDIARHAVEAGAKIINDVTGMEDEEMVRVALDSGAAVCAMHMLGTPQTMQDDPTYDNATGEILNYLLATKARLLEAGLDKRRICLDPGIGFGKTHEHNLQLIRECDQFLQLDTPILIGHSRKGFIGKIIGDKEADRDIATAAVSLRLAQQGMHILRVHNVVATRQALSSFAASGGLSEAESQAD